MEILEILQKVKGEDEVDLWKDLASIGQSSIPLLEKSKLFPIGKRRMRVLAEKDFDVPVVDLARGEFHAKQDYSIQENLDDEVMKLGHDFVEELPYNWEAMNPYVTQRLKEKEKPAQNVDRGIYGGFYDLFDAVTELSDPSINPDAIQKLYQLGTGFFQKKVEPTVKIDTSRTTMVNIEDQTNKINELKQYRKRAKILSLVGNMILVRSYFLEKQKSTKPDPFVPLEYLPPSSQISVEKIIHFLEIVLRTNYNEYVKNLTKLVWKTHILNGNLKRKIIEMKKSANFNEVDLCLYILYNYCERTTWATQKRIISSIYCSYQENLVSQMVTILKDRFLENQWKIISGNDLKSVLMDAMNLDEYQFKPIYQNLKRVFPREFQKGCFRDPRIKSVERYYIGAKYEVFTNRSFDLIGFENWCSKLSIDNPAFDHIVLYLFETRYKRVPPQTKTTFEEVYTNL
jgi:hypothetical protein